MGDVGSRRTLLHWLIPAVVIAALFAPIALTDRPFWVDASNQLWLIAQRQQILGGWTSYFVSSDRTGLFFPVFAFYGGTVYSAFGSLAAWLGDRILLVDALSWLLAFVMAYGGLTWISHQVGLRGWRTQVAGLVYVSSAYYLTNVYGRGAWTETIATSALPMVAAAGVWLVRRTSWHWLPMSAFVVSSVIFVGSHNITLFWGTIFLVLVASIALWALWPEVQSAIKPRVVVRVILLGALSAGITMVFFLPDLVYSSRTVIGASKHPFVLTTGPWVENFFVPLFHPLRSVPPRSSTPSIYLQLPVFVLLWLAAFGVLLIARRDRVARPLRRFFLGLGLLGAGVLVLLLWNGPWLHLPTIVLLIQFKDRLITCFVLVLSGLTIIALRALAEPRANSRPARPGRNVRRRSPDHPVWIVSLSIILVLGLGLGIWQVWASKSAFAHRADALTPHGFAPGSWYDPGSYNDVSQAVVRVVPARRVDLDARQEHGGVFEQVMDLPAGYQPIATNIAAGPDLIDVRGVVPVGRTKGGTGTCYLCGRPTMVVKRPPGHPTGPIKIRITGASNWPVVVGRWLSIASALAAMGWIAALGIARPRRRRRRLEGAPRPTTA
jgi:hypothetical protein